MDNGSIPDEGSVEIMEIEQEPETVEFTSFTDSVDENAVENLKLFWQRVERAHKNHGLSVTLNEADRSITLSTTPETTNPLIIHKARACIILASQFAYNVNAAYKLIDDKKYYEFIETGYQDNGIAAINRIDKIQFLLRRRLVDKCLGGIAVLCSCQLNCKTDRLVVSSRKLGDIKKYRSIVEKCLVEGLDPRKIKGYKMAVVNARMERLKV